jgi:hypothetical protein
MPYDGWSDAVLRTGILKSGSKWSCSLLSYRAFGPCFFSVAKGVGSVTFKTDSVLLIFRLVTHEVGSLGLFFCFLRLCPVLTWPVNRFRTDTDFAL